YDYRLNEGGAVMALGLQVALEGDLTDQALRGYYNLGDQRLLTGEPDEAVRLLDLGLALARERGDRGWERDMLAQLMQAREFRGEWDEAMALAQSLREGAHDESSRVA